MKKLLILLLAGLLIVTACSNGNSNPKESEQTPESTETENGGTGDSGGEEGNNQGGETTGTRPEVSGKLGKYGSPYEVGDIVFNDGSAILYTDLLKITDEQKACAIAIIFYKGTGLNSGNDTTTIRILGVGLKQDKTGLPWCTSSANAYSINITTIQESKKDGSNNLEYIEAFDGVDDTTGNGASDLYPAFYFAKNYSSIANNLGTTYSNGWYLPSIEELYQIYVNGKGKSKVFDINIANYLLGGDQFENDWYWSSSQDSEQDDGAYGGAFGNPVRLSYYKHASKNLVCAIREFN